MTLSVIIIAKNEAEAIGDCLASVAWANERIVLDGGSTDATAEIARRHGARVEVAAAWPGFGPQKNRALALANGDWVLSLDADEQVSPELRAEIEAVMRRPDAAPAYRMPRASRYCGRVLRHGGWWPDYVTRLFRRGQARFSDDLVHERLLVDGHAGTLSHALQHETYTTLDEALEKANRYSTLGAQQAFERGERATLGQACLHGFWAFFRTYVLRRGFLDGGHGLLLAVSNAQATFYRYAKLWLKCR
ncbi:MAG: glycosyltransferase family 2 protein [Betaproteobacteria bacterium]|nr:glycosyltransferase family 2 protein [Betaproteobacteria bacterium]MDE2131846.1 glycosyltransferase family 2 protein [Betaproteobacteria bacterium]MDE2211860.1 glycosyltransferase family 2 protein [Betaproteobacteria bacterium]